MVSSGNWYSWFPPLSLPSCNTSPGPGVGGEPKDQSLLKSCNKKSNVNPLNSSNTPGIIFDNTSFAPP